jgi:hypothetical protein
MDAEAFGRTSALSGAAGVVHEAQACARPARSV